MRTLHYGAALALAVGFAALAQTSASQQVTPPAASTPPATDATATSSAKGFKAGLVVKDSAGATIGKIAKAGAASDATVAVTVDGKTVDVATSALTLSPSGKEVVSSKSKAELKAAPS